MTTTAPSKTNKASIINQLQQAGEELSYLVNLIQLHHRNPNRKLKGLCNLWLAGHDVRTAQFDLSILKIDGIQASWIVLEEWERRKS